MLLLAMAEVQIKKDYRSAESGRFIHFCNDLLNQYVLSYQSALCRPPLITGHDLIQQLNLTPSPVFKTILTKVKEHTLAGEISSKQEALDMARNLTNDESPKWVG